MKKILLVLLLAVTFTFSGMSNGEQVFGRVIEGTTVEDSDSIVETTSYTSSSETVTQVVTTSSGGTLVGSEATFGTYSDAAGDYVQGVMSTGGPSTPVSWADPFGGN